MRPGTALTQKLATPWQRRWLNLTVTHPDLQTAADQIYNLFCTPLFRREGPPLKLVLCGPTGNGKTSLAVSISKWLRVVAIEAYEKKFWKDPPRSTLVRWQSVMDDIEDRNTGAALDPLLETELLVVDDVGAETDRFKSGKPVDALTQLLNQAQGRVWLVLTTNVVPGQWAEKWGERVEDRLLRDSIVIDLSSVPSWSKL